MVSSSFWQKIRADFPIVKSCIYLDHASGGPIPLPVAKVIAEHQHEHVHEGDFAWPKWMKRRDEMRCKVARFINADPEEIAFTTSTSHGMNLVAEMLTSKGKVLLNDIEFPSSTVPWLWRKSNVVWQKSHLGRVLLEDLQKKLTPEIKTIVSSYVQYGTGFRQDLTQLGKLKGSRYLVVNATQGFGSLPIDVKAWKADFLVANSYKWLMAGYGGGVLFMKKSLIKKMKPAGIGWRSMQNPDQMKNRVLDPRPDAARYEWGCPSFPTLFAFGAACDYLSGIGKEKIEKRILGLTDYAVELLEKAGFEIYSSRVEKEKSGIVIIKMEKSKEIWKRLLAKKTYTSPRGEGLRIAPHFYNSEEEIEKFVKALKSTMRRTR